MPSQRTLALLKPDLFSNPLSVSSVLNRLNREGFTIARSREVRWTVEDAKRFYLAHEGRFFYKRLVGFMCSGPFMAAVLEKENAIADWRQLIGPTHSVRARLSLGTLRGRFAVSDTRNAFHGSDSEESAREEIGFFFPDDR